MLVEPDRHPRPDAQDQVARDPRLPLRERTRARVVDVPGAAAAVPARRPVRVQVDAARVLARPGRVAVGIQVGHDPEVGTRPDALERAGDRDPGALGAVNATEHEHPRPLRVPAPHGRTAVVGAAEQQGGTGTRRRRGSPSDEQQRRDQPAPSESHRRDLRTREPRRAPRRSPRNPQAGHKLARTFGPGGPLKGQLTDANPTHGKTSVVRRGDADAEVGFRLAPTPPIAHVAPMSAAPSPFPSRLAAAQDDRDHDNDDEQEEEDGRKRQARAH